MKTSTRVRATKYLVMAGILLSYLSYGTAKLGVGELYPFFHWRLFSEPVGWEGARTYRIYFQEHPGAEWTRQPIQSTNTYTKKDYHYQLNDLISGARKDSTRNSDALERLEVFAETTTPGASSYKIVAESYHPLELLENSAEYDTATVIHITR